MGGVLGVVFLPAHPLNPFHRFLPFPVPFLRFSFRCVSCTPRLFGRISHPFGSSSLSRASLRVSGSRKSSSRPSTVPKRVPTRRGSLRNRTFPEGGEFRRADHEAHVFEFAFPSRDRDHSLRHIDPNHEIPALRNLETQVARPAPYI